jgi:phosphoribosyl-ATP pyrophosphohydrolase
LPKEAHKTSRWRLNSAPAEADDRLARLAAASAEVRAGRRPSPRTAKLLAAGAARMAHKLIEEAAETGIEAVLDQAVVVTERVDHWEALLGMAEKLPKTPDPEVSTPAAEQSFEPKDGGAWASR